MEIIKRQSLEFRFVGRDTDLRSAPTGGVNSQEVSSVIEAWYAVGVGSCTNEILDNTTVITSTTVRGCNIEVENVSVTNNSKLFLDAVFETTVNGPFEVESGSELEIK